MTVNNDELVRTLEEIWEAAENAESSRAGLNQTLDTIQGLIETVLPDVEERVTGIDPDDLDGDGVDDELELQANDPDEEEESYD